MNNYNNFRESDECRHLRKTALRKLLDEMSKLRSSEVERLLGWISVNDPVVEKPAWEKIAAGLQHRWEAESDWQMKDRFGNMLAGVLRDHLGAESWLAFLRTQLKGSPDESRAGHAKQLFEPCSANHGNSSTRTKFSGCCRKSPRQKTHRNG